MQNIGELATNRVKSIFAQDLETSRSAISSLLSGARVLVIGGAGSIGSATVQQLVKFGPASLHVIDLNENNLVELIRTLRNSKQKAEMPDLRFMPLDFGSDLFRLFLESEAPYDFVMNFAAVKHVRSEKDIFSILHMLDVNVVKQRRLLCWLASGDKPLQYFSVSTDKAANPVSLMGASKRLMEHQIFRYGAEANMISVTSARFANVAFSDGSLLNSWRYRIEKHQPVAVPSDTRRFFVTIPEAGEICLLASTLPKDKIIIPKLDAQFDLRPLEEIACAYVDYMGFKPALYHNEEQAIASVGADIAKGEYPVLITALDTSGEKAYEEFVGADEVVTDIGMSVLAGIEYRIDAAPVGLDDFLDSIERLLSGNQQMTGKQQIVEQVGELIPEFRHIETDISLDDRA